MSTDEVWISTLRRIAAIPLWGEPVPTGDLGDDLVFAGEHDFGQASFESTCDTESSQLRDAAVEVRAALAALEGRGT